MIVNPSFIQAIRSFEMPRYKIASKVRVHPNKLWKILSGFQKVSEIDEPILREIARLVGFEPKQVLVQEGGKQKADSNV